MLFLSCRMYMYIYIFQAYVFVFYRTFYLACEADSYGVRKIRFDVFFPPLYASESITPKTCFFPGGNFPRKPQSKKYFLRTEDNFAKATIFLTVGTTHTRQDRVWAPEAFGSIRAL